MIRVMDAFRISDTVYILTGGGPDNATEMAALLPIESPFSISIPATRRRSRTSLSSDRRFDPWLNVLFRERYERLA